MKKKLLEEVKVDYKKRDKQGYDFLYTLYELIPYGLKDNLSYNDADDSIYFGEKYICDLEEVSEVVDWSNLDKSLDISIHISKNDEKEFMSLWFFHRKGENGKWGFKEFQIGDWDYINIEDDPEFDEDILPLEDGDMPL